MEYTKVGDYYLPNLKLPDDEKDYFFGKYALLRKQYLENCRRVIFVNLLTSCKLNQHLAEIEEQAIKMVDDITKTLARENGIDETMKAKQQMEWVGAMNVLKAQAEEIVLKELIYV